MWRRQAAQTCSMQRPAPGGNGAWPAAGPAGEPSMDSCFPSDCNMVAIALRVYSVEPVRTTQHGIPVRTVKCLRKDGVNSSRTSFFDVWLWKELTKLSVKPGDAVVVSGRFVGLDAYLTREGRPAATAIISATGCSVVSDAERAANP